MCRIKTHILNHVEGDELGYYQGSKNIYGRNPEQIRFSSGAQFAETVSA
jgi:hypothetical protein